MLSVIISILAKKWNCYVHTFFRTHTISQYNLTFYKYCYIIYKLLVMKQLKKYGPRISITSKSTRLPTPIGKTEFSEFNSPSAMRDRRLFVTSTCHFFSKPIHCPFAESATAQPTCWPPMKYGQVPPNELRFSFYL